MFPSKYVLNNTNPRDNENQEHINVPLKPLRTPLKPDQSIKPSITFNTIKTKLIIEQRIIKEADLISALQSV